MIAVILVAILIVAGLLAVHWPRRDAALARRRRQARAAGGRSKRHSPTPFEE